METLKTMTYEATGRIARITLNRPERGNGITLNLPRELVDCVERADLQRKFSAQFLTVSHVTRRKAMPFNNVRQR